MTVMGSAVGTIAETCSCVQYVRSTAEVKPIVIQWEEVEIHAAFGTLYQFLSQYSQVYIGSDIACIPDARVSNSNINCNMVPI